MRPKLNLQFLPWKWIRYSKSIDVIVLSPSSDFACEWNTVQIAAHYSVKDASSSFIMRRTRFYRILKSEIFLQKRREIRAGCMTWYLPLAPVINKIVRNSLHEIYQFVTMLVKLAFSPSLYFFPKKAPTFLGYVFGKALYCVFTDFSEYGPEISPISQRSIHPYNKQCPNLLQKRKK